MDDTQVSYFKDTLPHHRLRVWHEAVELVRLVSQKPPKDKDLRDQALRAIKSCGLNVSEGAAHHGATRRYHLKKARGSVTEVVGAYELADAMGERLPLPDVRRRGAKIAAMLTNLLR